MNHVMEANDLWMGVPLQSDDHFWGEIGSVQFYCMLSRCEQGRGWGARKGGLFFPHILEDLFTLFQPEHINTCILPHPHIV